MNKKIAGTVLLIILVLTIALSVAYIVEESNHNCTGTECDVCERIKECINHLGNAVKINFISVFIAALNIFVYIYYSAGKDILTKSLISLKVELLA